MNMPIAATAGRSRLNAANGQGRGIAAQKNKRSKREISGWAWVVEEQVIKGGMWYPLAIYETRALSRVNAAHEYRPRGYVVRVRQYIRQQEMRP